MRAVVVFRNDDPSACSDVEHERHIASLFDRHGIRQTLGVVPLHCSGNPRDPTRQRLVRLDENPCMVKHLCEYIDTSGSEIALHGCTHQVSRLAKPSRGEESEFEGLPLGKQEELIARGTEVLVQVLGVKPCTFIPPWNRLDRNTVVACKKQGYRIVSSGPFAPVVEGIQSLGANCRLDTFRFLFETMRTGGHTVLLIVNYHSPKIRTQRDLQLLDDALKLAISSVDCEVLTLSETVRRYPELVRMSNEAAMNIVPPWQIPDSDRSRAAVYERILCRVGVRNGLAEARASAGNLYWQGRYEEACELTPWVDTLYGRLLRSGRFLALTTGMVVGVLLWAILFRYGVSSRIGVYTGVLILPVALGAACFWYLTDQGAKRETLLATLLNALAVASAFTVGELVSWFYLAAQL